MRYDGSTLQRSLSLSDCIRRIEGAQSRKGGEERVKGRGEKREGEAGNSPQWREAPSIIFHVNALSARRFFLMTVLINIQLGAVASSCL